MLIGDTNDAAFLTKAFHGADAVYTLLPTDPNSPDYRAAQDQQGEAVDEAIRNSGVKYVVALSSLGGDLTEGTGVIEGLHAQEERLELLEGGILIVLGLFTRPVAFILSGMMAVALWQFHFPSGNWPVKNQGMPAVLFCFIFLYMAAKGAGEWSVNALIRRKRGSIANG